MKLYTEEQVVRAMSIAVYNKYEKYMEVLDLLTPIELPSDEEIEEVSDTRLLYTNDNSANFRLGAKWMKEQILNQNK